MVRRIIAVLLSVVLTSVFFISLIDPDTINADSEVPSTVGLYVDCQYQQTYCRTTLLNELNEFRTGSEAWYYNPDGSIYTCSGLQPMRFDYSLEQMAMQRAAEQAVKFAHTRPDGSSCFTVSCDNIRSHGENCAYASGFSLDPIYMWEENGCGYDGQGHRRLMLSGFNSVGIAVVTVGDSTFAVMEVANIDPADAVDVTPAVDSTVSVRVDTLPEYIDYFACSSGNIVNVNNYYIDLKSITVYAYPVDQAGFEVKRYKVDMTGMDWYSTASDVLLIDNGKVTAVQEGTYLVIFSNGDAGGGITYTSVDVPAYASPRRTYSVLQFVSRLYTIILEREGDVDGLRHWTEMLLSGQMSGKDVADGFFDSPEFCSRWMSDREFLTLLYRTFFNREPDEGGMNTWMHALYPNDDMYGRGGISWRDIYNAFNNSEEWKNLCSSYGIAPNPQALASMPPVSATPISYDDVEAFVTRLYTTCLMREPDPSGAEDWFYRIVDRVESGSQVAYGFFFSDEFIAYGLSDEEYVTRLYHTFFDREPDPGGFADWLGRLSSGASRKDVFDGFAGSQEWIQLCERYGIIR